MSSKTEIHVVELTDESDELIGYGVCIIVIDQATRRQTFVMRPWVCGTRSEAHTLALDERDGVVA